MAKKLSHIQNYMVYYGEASQTELTQLLQYDLVILEPSLHSRTTIQYLQEQGILVLGYLSVMEAPEWNKWRSQYLQPNHYLRVGEKRFHLPHWNAYLMDLAETEYRNILLQEAHNILSHKGFDGLLIDTIDDLDLLEQFPDLYQELLHSYQELLISLRNQHPDRTLIQNRGFSTLPDVLPYINGLLWENWHGDWLKNPIIRKQMELMIDARSSGLTIFTLSFGSESIHNKQAKKHGFIHLSRNSDYHTLQIK